MHTGGADLSYVKSLVNSNISMDMVTFTSLDESVVLVSGVFAVCLVVCQFSVLSFKVIVLLVQKRIVDKG